MRRGSVIFNMICSWRSSVLMESTDSSRGMRKTRGCDERRAHIVLQIVVDRLG